MLTQKERRKIKIKVLFQIGDRSLDIEEYFEELAQQEKQSKDDESEESIDDFEFDSGEEKENIL